MVWDSAAKILKLQFTHDAESYQQAGSGYALLALAWPSHAFTMTPDGRSYVAGSVLQKLQSDGVQYIYSTLLCDTECLSCTAPAADPAMVGPALYAMDHRGANMAVQALVTSTDQCARTSHSLVLSPSVGGFYCNSVSLSDLQSVATRPIIKAQVDSGVVVNSTSR